MSVWDLYQLIRGKYYNIIARFAIQNIAKDAKVSKLAGIFGGKNIDVRSKVKIWDYTWLAALSPTKSDVQLIIGEGTTIGRFNHIYATKKIEFGCNVLTADKVYISDNLHEYADVHKPIKQQPIKQLKEVYLGDGCWIGENVCIIGASIGKNSVIGANSIVTKDIPDFCVAVGVPAKVIKKFDFINNQWTSVK